MIKEYFPDAKSFAEAMHPTKCLVRYKSFFTPYSCLENLQIIKLSEIKIIYGKETLEWIISGWIFFLNEGLNLKKMTDFQINLTVAFILEDYYYFNLAEITLAFKWMVKGKLGEIYNRLDPQIIMKLLGEYRRLRLDAFHKIENDEKSNAHGEVDYEKRLNYLNSKSKQ